MNTIKSGALKTYVTFGSDQKMNMLISSGAGFSFVSTALCDDCQTTHKLRAGHIDLKYIMMYLAFDNEQLVSVEYLMYGDFALTIITNFQEEEQFDKISLQFQGVVYVANYDTRVKVKYVSPEIDGVLAFKNLLPKTSYSMAPIPRIFGFYVGHGNETGYLQIGNFSLDAILPGHNITIFKAWIAGTINIDMLTIGFNTSN